MSGSIDRPAPAERVATDESSSVDLGSSEHCNDAGAARESMIHVPGGTFRMGSDRHYPEEAPVHRVTVDPFWIDETPVTNAEFRRFVEETGYVTFAELAPNANDYPGALPHMLKAGSLVFNPPAGEVDLRNWSVWWEFRFGANWRHPYGRGSWIKGLDDHPAVHVAYCDAEAYARWVGKELPTEAEWEFAARAGLDGAEYAWGDEFTPGGRHMANTWQGAFPRENLKLDGYDRTSPVRAFPPNAYGIHDMIGNVWEWTSDWYAPKHPAEAEKACCIPKIPRGPREDPGRFRRLRCARSSNMQRCFLSRSWQSWSVALRNWLTRGYSFLTVTPKRALPNFNRQGSPLHLNRRHSYF